MNYKKNTQSHKNGRNIFILYTLLIIFTSILSSCATDSSFNRKIQSYLDSGKLLIPVTKQIPLTVRALNDKTGRISCTEIPENAWSFRSSHFNPGIYEGVYWLDVFFADTQDFSGSEYNFIFGVEPYLLIEIYIQKNNEWQLYGRTGRIISEDKCTSLHWVQNLTLNEAFLDKEQIHNVRIKMVNQNGSPISLMLLPQRNFQQSATVLTMINLCLAGIFLIAICFFFIYGILYKDKIYILLGITTTLGYLTELEIKGIGPIYLWNRISFLRTGFWVVYVFSSLTVFFLTLLLINIILENSKSIKVRQLFDFVLLHDLCNAVFSIIIQKTMLAYLLFITNLLFDCILLMISLFSNISKEHKKINWYLSWFITLFACILFRHVFHILRIFLPQKIFMLFDYDLYITFDFYMLLIIIPSLINCFVRARRYLSILHSRYDYANRKIKELTEENHLKYSILQEIFNNQTLIENVINLPNQTDRENTKEIFDLIKRSSIHSLDLLYISNELEKTIVQEEKTINLLNYFYSCREICDSLANARDTRINVTASLPDDLLVYSNERFLEFFFVDYLTTLLELSQRHSKISVDLSVMENQFKYKVTLNFSRMTNDELQRYFKIERHHPEFIFKLVKKIVSLYNGTFTYYIENLKFISDIRIELPVISGNLNKDIAVIDEVENSLLKERLNKVSMESYVSENIFLLGNRTPTIMIIENNIQLLEQITKNLRKHVTIMKSVNSLEAWNVLNSLSDQSIPDLIISEYSIPLLAGNEIMRKCREEKKLMNIPFIFLLNNSEYEKKYVLINEGAFDCLTKPFSQTQLFSKIYSLITLENKVHNSLISKITNVVSTSNSDIKPVIYTQKAITDSINPSREEKIEYISPSSSQNVLFLENQLSTREKQIALLISSGKSDKQIADELNISTATVATHNKKIFKKLGVHSRVELMNKVR